MSAEWRTSPGCEIFSSVAECAYDQGFRGRCRWQTSGCPDTPERLLAPHVHASGVVTTLSNDLFHNFPAKFDSVADLHVANTDDLQRVDSIGNKTAEKLQHER